MTKIELIMKKTLGCYRTFGLKEVGSRTIREILRPIVRTKKRLDVSMVTEKLAIGAAPRSDDGIRLLVRLGFNQVIDLRGERKDSDVLAVTTEIQVHWIPTHDDWELKSHAFFSQLMGKFEELLRLDGTSKLLICCSAGEHRAPLAGLQALLLAGCPMETAISIIRKARPVAELLPSYTSSLEGFMGGLASAEKEKRVSSWSAQP